jgi:hypothetical protein
LGGWGQIDSQREASCLRGQAMKAKRIVSLFVALLAALAGIVFLGEAMLLVGDFRLQGVPKLPTAIGEFVVLSLAGLSWFEAYRFLKYFLRRVR